MTRREENLALLDALRRIPAAIALDFPRSLATAQQFLRSIEAIRHAGLFLAFMEGDRPRSADDQVSELLLEAAHDYYGQMQSRFDGLAGQEQAVFALEHANPQVLRALPQIILIDGFYDLHPLYQRAIAGLTTHAQSLFFSLPIVPGDETVRRLAAFIDSLGLDAEKTSSGSALPNELLSAIATTKVDAPTEAPAFPEPLAGGNIETHALSTYLREAEYIADTGLAFHRREGIPLAEFLVILNHPAAAFVSALERQFADRKLPLIDLRPIQRPRPAAGLLKAAFAYAAHPQPDTLRRLINASCPVVLEPTHETFAYLYRMGVFLETGKTSQFLRDAGQEDFARLLERLDFLRKELSPTGPFNTIRSYAEEIGKETLARMTGDSVQVQLDKESLAAEEAALRGIVEALNVPSDRPRPPFDLLLLASEACSLYAGR